MHLKIYSVVPFCPTRMRTRHARFYSHNLILKSIKRSYWMNAGAFYLLVLCQLTSEFFFFHWKRKAVSSLFVSQALVEASCLWEWLIVQFMYLYFPYYMGFYCTIKHTLVMFCCSNQQSSSIYKAECPNGHCNHPSFDVVCDLWLWLWLRRNIIALETNP